MSVALLALFISLAGTATAARIFTGRNIKDGTIRRDDIARSAIDSGKVANGSLSTNDLDAEARGAIAQAGTQSLEVFRGSGPVDQPANSTKTVATLKNIPPGAYAIFAKVVLNAPTDSGLLGQGNSAGGKCVLDVGGGETDESRTAISGFASSSPGTTHMQTTKTFASVGQAQVDCSVNGADWSAANTSIIALRVSAPSKQPVDGR
jgi:hypothetical protein